MKNYQKKYGESSITLCHNHKNCFDYLCQEIAIMVLIQTVNQLRIQSILMLGEPFCLVYADENGYCFQSPACFLAIYDVGELLLRQQENQQLMDRNRTFQNQLQHEEEKLLNIRGKRKQKKIDDADYTEEKRSYRNRRLWLQKNFPCSSQNCGKKYSSQMALRNHEREKHEIRRRAPFQSE